MTYIKPGLMVRPLSTSDFTAGGEFVRNVKKPLEWLPWGPGPNL